MMAIEDTGDAAENAPDAEEDMEAPPDDVMVFSAREVLRKKDFSQFSADEIAEARRMIESMTWRLGTRKTRRLEPSNSGDFFDYRRTLRASMKYKGVPINLKRRERKDRMRPLILICDISDRWIATAPAAALRARARARSRHGRSIRVQHPADAHHP
ncbi:MAG: VWA domain-containing protein [Thermomicrobiales bacterium]